MPRLGVVGALEGGGDDPGPYVRVHRAEHLPGWCRNCLGLTSRPQAHLIIDVELVEDVDVEEVEVPKTSTYSIVTSCGSNETRSSLPLPVVPLQELELGRRGFWNRTGP